jgi:transcriptional regulator with XRE-family HTH domain
MTGPELRALRDAKGYSLTALAKALGVHVTTVCRWQKGKARIPHATEIVLRQLPNRYSEKG